MGDGRPFVRRVALKNYRSIGACDVQLGRFTIIVGRNGAGKSNFLDALRFVADGLQTTVDQAVKSRGGIDNVRRRSTGHPRNFGIRLELQLDASIATFAFEIGARKSAGFVVKRESVRVEDPASGLPLASYEVQAGQVVASSFPHPPAAHAERLYLVTASGLPHLSEVYGRLSAMGFYNLNPEEMRDLQSPDSGELLHRDGANITSVIARLAHEQPESHRRLVDYLQSIVPGIEGVERKSLGPKETLEFRQAVSGADHPWRFYATSMSDGTLRALGVLAAVMQLAERSHVPLVGIEEPETALHPAACGALMDALAEAALHTQVVVTSHSGVLLDAVSEVYDLLVAATDAGETRIAPVDAASRSAIRDHLYEAGELLRLDQLEPDPTRLPDERQLDLFAEGR